MTPRFQLRAVVALVTLVATPAFAQPAGTVTWQLQPFCNRVTVTTTESDGVYALSGYDDLCGGGQRAPVVGVASPNPDGSLNLGLTTILPDGRSRTAIATVASPAWSGTWRGASGSGTFALDGNGGGTPLDAPRSASGGPTAGGGDQAADGRGGNDVAGGCEPGDITAVFASFGLSGGGTSGDVALYVDYGGDGSSFEVARADHEHSQGGGGIGVGFQALASAFEGGSVAVGSSALRANSVGAFNIAIGNSALFTNTFGDDNIAVGAAALYNSVTGNGNTALGGSALDTNTTGSDNTALGFRADVNAGTLTNATALGARSRVDQSNSLVLGSVRSANGAQSGVKVGIGTTAPGSVLDLVDDLSLGGDSFTATRHHDSAAAPVLTFRKSRGTVLAPTGVLSGDNLLFLRATGHNGTSMSSTGRATVIGEAAETWAIGSEGARWTFSTTANGSTATLERMRIDHDGEVGIGTTNPLARLHVAGGALRVDTLGTAGTTPLCRNGSNQIASCSSSVRYKSDVSAFSGGLDMVDRLQPIAYTWTESGAADVGFGAEDVAVIDRRLVIHDDAGRVEGVKYDRLTTVLVNAVKELAAQNAALERRLRDLEADAKRR